MKKEVADKKKEAFEIAYQCYMNERKKRLLVLLAVSILLTITAWGFMYARNATYSYFSITFMLPVMFQWMKASRDAGKYARNKIRRGGS